MLLSAQVFSCEFCEISKNTFSYKNMSGGCFYPFLNDTHMEKLVLYSIRFIYLFIYLL